LGAVGSNPFGSFTRVDIAGTIRPGDTYTFNFTLTAPGTPGTYTTDWRMVRDGYAWFGATVSKTVDVGNDTDTEPPTVPQNLRVTGVTKSSVSLAWDASTDNFSVHGYRVYRVFATWALQGKEPIAACAQMIISAQMQTAIAVQ